MSQPRVIAILPARHASTRFPGKPLHPLLGRAMILRVIDRARECPAICEVYVATDDARIAAVVEADGQRAIMTSDAARSGSDRIAEALRVIEAEGGAPVEAIVNIQGDEPLIHPDTLTAAVRALLDHPDCAVSTTCVELRRRAEFESPHNVKVVFAAGGRALYFSRSPIPSPARRPEADLAEGALMGHKHQGLYVFRREALLAFTRLPAGRLEEIEKLEQLRFLEHGHEIQVVVTPHDSPGVDTPGDVADVEARLRARGLA